MKNLISKRSILLVLKTGAPRGTRGTGVVEFTSLRPSYLTTPACCNDTRDVLVENRMFLILDPWFLVFFGWGQGATGQPRRRLIPPQVFPTTASPPCYIWESEAMELNW